MGVKIMSNFNDKTYKQGDKVIIISGEHIHGLTIGKEYLIASVSPTGQVFIRNERGFSKWVGANEIKRVEVNYSDEIPEGETAPRFFKRVTPPEDDETAYYHTEGITYIECSRENQKEYDFDEGDDQEGDVYLYTDCPDTVIIYAKEYMEENFKEVY